MSDKEIKTDALVIGGGIAGLQSALDLADQGFKVVVVERNPSIGGRMISLSKVFPTLDCASCITTPKMAAAAHHDNITILTYSYVDSFRETNGGFTADVVRKARYVDEEKCIGCRQCEYDCPVDAPHEFEGGFGARRAIYVPFTNAVPQYALVDENDCILCGKCEKVCPTGAVDLLQKESHVTVKAGTVVVATGFDSTPAGAKPEYGYGKIKNVLTGLQMERLIAPHGPYGHVLRPSDGKLPGSIAYIQCAGSRDKSVGVPYCSRVCCMYATKQAMLLSGILPMADITIYYMDIRAFGKGYEQFYQSAKAMGIEYIKGKVARIKQGANDNPIVRVEMLEEDGRVEEREHELVVLSTGLQPAWRPDGLEPLMADEDGFIHCPASKISPALTDWPGVFVAGTAAGPKDIVDTIVEAGAAAMEAANYLRTRSGADEKSSAEADQLVRAS